MGTVCRMSTGKNHTSTSCDRQPAPLPSCIELIGTKARAHSDVWSIRCQLKSLYAAWYASAPKTGRSPDPQMATKAAGIAAEHLSLLLTVHVDYLVSTSGPHKDIECRRACHCVALCSHAHDSSPKQANAKQYPDRNANPHAKRKGRARVESPQVLFCTARHRNPAQMQETEAKTLGHEQQTYMSLHCVTSNSLDPAAPDIKTHTDRLFPTCTAYATHDITWGCCVCTAPVGCATSPCTRTCDADTTPLLRIMYPTHTAFQAKGHPRQQERRESTPTTATTTLDMRKATPPRHHH